MEGWVGVLVALKGEKRNTGKAGLKLCSISGGELLFCSQLCFSKGSHLPWAVGCFMEGRAFSP